MDSYVSLDLETTGLSPKYDKIIEIGAVKVMEGRVSDSFSTFVTPGRRLEEHVTEITGITGEDLDGAPEIGEILPELLEFTGGLPLLGHRILFDYSFVKHAAVNLKLDFEKEGVDTLKLSRICHRELESKRLTDMCAFYGITYQAHRALNDAEATHRLYECLKNEFSASQPELFIPEKLIYRVKKESPIRPAQLEMLKTLIERYGIDCPYELQKMTRNEASRYYDKICAQYGAKKNGKKN